MTRQLAFLLVFLPTMITGQQREAPLVTNGPGTALRVAPDSSVRVTHAVTPIAFAATADSSWRIVYLNFYDKGSTNLRNPVFFNRDTGFIPVTDYSEHVPEFILRTVNGGKSWDSISLGMNGGSHEAICIPNGQAWLRISNGGLLHTKDYGLNWKKVEVPGGEESIESLYFNHQNKGLIGAGKNQLLYTKNNGANWKKLPTPLDQKKYRNTGGWDPTIDLVAIVGNFFLVKQSELIFYSPIDSVDWKALPAYRHFYTDPEGSTLVFRAKNGALVKVDKTFSPVFKFHYEEEIFSVQSRHGNFYLVGNDTVYHVTANNRLRHIPLPEPMEVTDLYENIGNEQFGYAGNRIYAKMIGEKDWHYKFSFPFSIDPSKLEAINESFRQEKDDSLYYYDTNGKEIKRHSRYDYIADFLKPGIKQIVFNQGASGCFHSSRKELIYDNQISSFGKPYVKHHGEYDALPAYPGEIDKEAVDEFLKALPSLFDKKSVTSIGDLDFSESDIRRLRKDVQHYVAAKMNGKKANDPFQIMESNLDYERLLRLPDSVKYIKPAKLNEYLTRLDNMISTSSEFKQMVLVNYRNERLILNYSWYEGNPYYYPLYIHCNDLSVQSTDATVQKFIESIYPGFLNKQNKMGILHALVRKMYLDQP